MNLLFALYKRGIDLEKFYEENCDKYDKNFN